MSSLRTHPNSADPRPERVCRARCERFESSARVPGRDVEEGEIRPATGFETTRAAGEIESPRAALGRGTQHVARRELRV